LRYRNHEAVALRHHLEGWSARLRAQEANWESERDRLLVDVKSRAEVTERHLGVLVELRQRWIKRRRHELELIRAERAACEQLRQECTPLREGLWQRTKAIDEERRTLAEQSLALEQYRQQYVLSSDDAAGAEKRVERLRRRWTTQTADTARALASEREAVKNEVTQL